MADRREALAKAFDKLEKEDDDELSSTDEGTTDEELEGSGEGAPDDGEPSGDEGDGEQADGAPEEGKQGKQKGEKESAKPKEGQEAGAQGKQGKDAGKGKKDGVNANQQEQQAQQLPTDRAPVSWKPAIREAWAKIPPEARAEITRREREVQQVLSQTDNLRRFSNDLANVIAPHQDLIRAQNSTPLQAIDNMMKTASTLMRGSSMQKAHTVAQIIRNYGIDIAELDKVLHGMVTSGNFQPGNPQPQNEAPPAWARPMFDFMSNVEQQRQQRQQQLQQQAEEQIAIAEDTLPYFADLKEEVSDIMEVNWRRGRNITIQQAYEKALENNPDIKKLIPRSQLRQNGQQRQQQQSQQRSDVSQAASTLAKARRASSAVSGGPAGGDGKVAPKTRREALEQAFDDAST